MRKVLQLLTISFLVVAVAIAGTTGKISGRVVDQKTGEGLVGATVMVQGTSLGASTDIEGFYSVINVPPGSHTVAVQLVGYSKYLVKDVAVSVDRTTRIDVRMMEESIEMGEVVVQAERAPVQRDRTYSASVVNSSTIEAMPVTSVSEVIQLQPGVVSSGDELHFRGGREREVAYVIDGVPITNTFNQEGGSNVTVENSMIQELEVISGTFNAEYGAAQSGIVNIVTKGIASRWGGSVALYSGDWLSGKSDIFLGVEKFNPTSERDGQFSLSGPIVPEKLGFSVSGRYNRDESLAWYERRFNTSDGWKIAAYQRWFQEQRAAEVSQSQAIPIPDSLMTGDRSRGPLATFEAYSINAKLNYSLLSGMIVSYQFFGSWNTTLGSASRFRRYQPDDEGKSFQWSNSHFVTARYAPSDNLFANIRFSYQFNDGESYYRKDNKVARVPGDEGITPIAASADGFSLGNTSSFFTDAEGKNFRQMVYVGGDVNWQIDKYNLIKAGVEYKRHRVNTYSWGYIETVEWQNKKWLTFQPDSSLTFDRYWQIMTQYWRAWEDSFHTTRYRRYNESEYTLWRDYTIRPSELAFYVQDKVELGEIVVNGGVRFDMFIPREKVPANYSTESFNLGSAQNLVRAKNKYQLSPRLGISFPISAVGVFHAAYGHFFQMPSFEKMFNEPLYALTAIQLEGRVLGNANLDPEKTVQYEIGLQQEIVPGIAVDVTAYYKDIRNLLGLEYVTTVDNVRYQRYINRDYGNSKGITVGVRKNSGMVTGALNYSYATANGSASNPDAIAIIQASTQIGGPPVTFIDRQIVPLDWDQRHTLNAIVNIASPGDWSIGLVGYFWSGQPYSPTFVEKFDILEREYRNAASKPLQWNVDLKAQKTFAMGGLNYTLFLKIDNIFDNLNENGVYTSTGTAAYTARLPVQKQLELERLIQQNLFTLSEIDNQPAWYSPPRRIQFGITVDF